MFIAKDSRTEWRACLGLTETFSDCLRDMQNFPHENVLVFFDLDGHVTLQAIRVQWLPT